MERRYRRNWPGCIRHKHDQAAGQVLTTDFENKFRLVNPLVISEEPCASFQNAEGADGWEVLQVLRVIVPRRGRRGP